MFDIKKFEETKFKENIKDIEIVELKSFFDEKEKPIWKVKALTGHELAKVNDSVKQNKDLSTLIQGIVGSSKEKVESIKEVMGISDNTADDLVRRISILVYGSVEPKITQEISVKFADVYPTQFYLLTNEIMGLTGSGKLSGE